MLTEEDIQKQYPLHYLIWNNDFEKLEKYLKDHSKDVDIEQKDPRHRTPLMLATTLDHKECVRILLDRNALVNVTDHTGFNVLHEAVTTADPKLIRDVLMKKKLQRYSIRVDGIPNLLSKICDTSDFYIEMKWEFTSWVPLISQLCPSDTYKIYKRGSKVRVDSTLVGMDDATTWQRGDKSLIFIGSKQGASFMEVDHLEKRVHKHTLEIMKPDEISDYCHITEDQIADRLTMPIKTTFIDTEKVQFERAKSGIIGFRTDRVETFNGYECKVYWAQNVEFVTKTRIEHLTQEDKNRYKKLKDSSAIAPFRSFVGIHEQNIPNPFQNESLEDQWRRNPYQLSMVDYFNLKSDDPKDIGAPREMNIKKQYFKANVWMSDDYPLSLKEQILPIVDMVATYSSHFAKLRDFIACKLPSGFPVKIEIPLFHLLNAKITFENVFAHQRPVDGVHLNIPEPTNTADMNPEDPSISTSCSKDNLRNCKCTIDDKCFEPPEGFEIIGSDSYNHDNMEFGLDATEEDDEDYLKLILGQYSKQQTTANTTTSTTSSSSPSSTTTAVTGAISESNKNNNRQYRDSVLGTEQLSIMEALSYDSEKDLQRAIQLSLMEYNQHQQQILAAAQQQQPVHQPHSNGSVVKSSFKSTSSSKEHDCNVKTVVQEKLLDKEKDPVEDDDTSSTASYTSCDNNDNNDPNQLSPSILENDTLVVPNDKPEMNESNNGKSNNDDNRNNKIDEEQIIRLTMEQSKRDHDEQLRLQQEEQEQLEKILKLSLTEK